MSARAASCLQMCELTRTARSLLRSPVLALMCLDATHGHIRFHRCVAGGQHCWARMLWLQAAHARREDAVLMKCDAHTAGDGANGGGALQGSTLHGDSAAPGQERCRESAAGALRLQRCRASPRGGQACDAGIAYHNSQFCLLVRTDASTMCPRYNTCIYAMRADLPIFAAQNLSMRL